MGQGIGNHRNGRFCRTGIGDHFVGQFWFLPSQPLALQLRPLFVGQSYAAASNSDHSICLGRIDKHNSKDPLSLASRFHIPTAQARLCGQNGQVVKLPYNVGKSTRKAALAELRAWA